MKKRLIKNLLTATAFLPVSCYTMAQSPQASIQVQGSASYIRTVEKYTAEIILSGANYDYGNYKGLDEMKKEFARFLEENDMKKELFMEHADLFFLVDGYAEGTLYRFETTRKEDFVKLNRLYKLRNARVHTKKLVHKPVPDNVALVKQALEDATRKAGISAGVAGKKLGTIIEITDYNNLSAEGYNYYEYESKGEYVISVKFSIE